MISPGNLPKWTNCMMNPTTTKITPIIMNNFPKPVIVLEPPIENADMLR